MNGFLARNVVVSVGTFVALLMSGGALASTQPISPCGISFEFANFASHNPYPPCANKVAPPTSGASTVSISAPLTVRAGARTAFTMVGYAARTEHLVFAAQTFACKASAKGDIAAMEASKGLDGTPTGVYVMRTFDMDGHFSVLSASLTPVLHICAYLVDGPGNDSPAVGHAATTVKILPAP